MTKEQEELYRWFDEELSCNFHMLVTRMNEFFDSNVCIPKGENRHPYADVLHEVAENTDLILEFKLPHVWASVGIEKDDEYRVKPSEPVYEYLYYSRIGNTIWSTKEEAPINMWCAEETKRVRT